MAKKVGAGAKGSDAPKFNHVMVIKKGRAVMEVRDGNRVLSSRRVTRRNRFKG